LPLFTELPEVVEIPGAAHAVPVSQVAILADVNFGATRYVEEKLV
jgi:hypothetical protein